MPVESSSKSGSVSARRWVSWVDEPPAGEYEVLRPLRLEDPALPSSDVVAAYLAMRARGRCPFNERGFIRVLDCMATHVDQRLVTDAMEQFARAYPGSPRTPRVLLSLGETYDRMGETRLSQATYDRLLADYEDDPSASTLRIKILLADGVSPYRS